MLVPQKRLYTLEEYLEMDRLSDARWEYFAGEVVELSGVDLAHAEIEVNLATYLGNRLRQPRCRLFLARMRLKVPSHPPYRYGDTSALCGQAQFEKIGCVDVLTNPTLIIEVLSESTESYDRGLKFSHYKSIPSFCEYLLIAQDHPYVTHYIKLEDNIWQQREYTNLNDEVQLVSVGCEISLRALYENVTFKEHKPKLRPLE